MATTADAFEDSASVKGLLSRLDDTGYDGRGQPLGPINPTVLFVDEAHRLNRQSQELLYAAVEDRVLDTRVRDPLTGLWKHCREWVPSFTLICASNRPGDLTASFRDRLRLELRLELYGLTDSVKIVRQVFAKMNLKCGPSQAAQIAARGRGVPRKLVGLCEHVRDITIGKGKPSISAGNCQRAFDAICIDTIGLSRQDVELLRHLAPERRSAARVKTLAAMIHEDERALEENIEPFLLFEGAACSNAEGPCDHGKWDRTPAPASRLAGKWKESRMSAVLRILERTRDDEALVANFILGRPVGTAADLRRRSSFLPFMGEQAMPQHRIHRSARIH